MLNSNMIYNCRRKALGMTTEELAEKAGVSKELVIDFENGDFVPYFEYQKIKNTIYQEFNSLKTMAHCKKRVLELAMELALSQDDDMDQLQYIQHMLIELGRIQGEIIGFDSSARRG